MDALKQSLTAQADIQFISVGDLTVDRTYPIMKMVNQDTQYGRTIVCTLKDIAGSLFQVYLPKSIQLEDDEILEFNSRTEKTINLVFKGRRGRAFNIAFV